MMNLKQVESVHYKVLWIPSGFVFWLTQYICSNREMKTSECWFTLPRHALIVMTDRLYIGHHLRLWRSCFSIWRHWPLTYDLELCTPLRYCWGPSTHQMLGPYVTCFSGRELTCRHRVWWSHWASMRRWIWPISSVIYPADNWHWQLAHNTKIP